LAAGHFRNLADFSDYIRSICKAKIFVLLAPDKAESFQTGSYKGQNLNDSQMILRKVKSLFIFIFFTAVFPFLSALSTYADIYMFTDKEGVIHFTNVPTSMRYRLYLKEKSATYSIFTDRYDHIIKKASGTYGVDFSLLKAMIKVESNFDPKAVSRAGAVGLMQIMPANFKVLNINDPFDPWENINGGATYFKSLLTLFKGKLPLALAAYNAGPDRVHRGNKIPPIKETEDYVKKVMKYYAVFKDKALLR